jgi:hypothetical protein
MSTLTPESRIGLKMLCEQVHPAEVLGAVAEVLERRKLDALSKLHNAAIAAEWGRALRLVQRAIEEIKP